MNKHVKYIIVQYSKKQSNINELFTKWCYKTAAMAVEIIMILPFTTQCQRWYSHIYQKSNVLGQTVQIQQVSASMTVHEFSGLYPADGGSLRTSEKEDKDIQM